MKNWVFYFWLVACCVWLVPAPHGASAQTGPKPDWSWLTGLRVLTEADYPPFNYYDEEGQLTGFNVDLARAICRELAVTCEINTGDWNTLIPSLQNNEADAVAASLAITAKSLSQVDFTGRYYSTPARFAAKVGSGISEISVAALKGKKIAVVQGTAHEAFLRDFFEGAQIMPYPTPAEARAALKKGDADLMFGDGISLMFWIQGTGSARCCEFKGEGYSEPRYFGDGVGIAVKKGNARLLEVLDYALARVKASGRYEELMLRYFPLPLY
ncbi:MAG: transporter substrate-binding domain-containing protein [Rhodomicrobium sp.]